MMRPNPYDRELELVKQMRRERPGKRQMSPVTAWSLIVIGSLIVIMFLPALVDEVLTYRRQAGAAVLPTVDGEVLESRVHSEARRSYKTSVSRHTEPLIRYRYEVNGQSYESSRFAFQDFVLLQAECEAIVARHPPGSVVRVHYHPNNPELAAISTRQAVLNYFIVLLCLAVLLLGTGVVVRGMWARPWQGGGNPHAEVLEPVMDFPP